MTNYKIKKPVLTVYMPVFNAGKYIPQAIDSILNQSYSNFEFIIVDDASTDNSWKIIQKYALLDKRIRTYQNKLNLGVSLTSNIAISYARGRYLARIDADDMAMPDRFQEQIAYLKKHLKTVAVGAQCIVIDADNRIIGYKKFPTDPQKIKEMLFWAIPMQQPAMMINLNLLPKNFAWYDRNKSSAEEVNLMFNFIKYGSLGNLPDFQLYYRQLPTSLSRRNPKQTYYLTLQSRLLALEKGYRPTLFSLLLNLAQFAAVTLLPTVVINNLWNFIRGISAGNSQFEIGTLATNKV
ncbi:MAG: glycosyltransferase family A protein [Candidatus Shapirobacteria bacterium]